MGKKMNMNISVNGQSRVPPGFRFHPTEEELLQYYLRKKVANDDIDLDVIFEVDLNKLEPWDIQEKCSIGTAPQNDWYFFSHKDKKYPTGTRTNRATAAGFWKATGRDKVIYNNGIRIGMRKTLVFYKGRAPHGLKSDWIMHEYRLHESNSHSDSHHITNSVNGEEGEEGWVVCRIFKKKNHIKTHVDSPINTFEAQHHSTTINDSSSDPNHDDQGALEQIFQIIKTNPPYIQTTSINHPNPNLNTNLQIHEAQANTYQHPVQLENNVVSETGGLGLSDWAALDRFVATHLNGQTTTSLADQRDDSLQLPPLMTSSPCNKIYQPAATLDNFGVNETDLWSFTRSSSSSSLGIDPLCHVSNPDS